MSSTVNKPSRAGAWQRTSRPSPAQPRGTAGEKVQVCHGGSSTDFYTASKMLSTPSGDSISAWVVRMPSARGFESSQGAVE